MQVAGAVLVLAFPIHQEMVAVAVVVPCAQAFHNHAIAQAFPVAVVEVFLPLLESPSHHPFL